MTNITIILSSTRPKRFSPQPGQWLAELSKQLPDTNFTIADLNEVDLPFLNERESAMFGPYEHDHTKAWAKTIEAADGFIFVVAEYNHGYPAPLKNAIDYLYTEWLHKPVAFASYGSVAGGARAVEQLREVVGHLSMYDISEHLILPEYYMHLDEKGKFKFTERHEQTALKMMKQLVFWADKMKSARKELNA